MRLLTMFLFVTLIAGCATPDETAAPSSAAPPNPVVVTDPTLHLQGLGAIRKSSESLTATAVVPYRDDPEKLSELQIAYNELAGAVDGWTNNYVRFLDEKNKDEKAALQNALDKGNGQIEIKYAQLKQVGTSLIIGQQQEDVLSVVAAAKTLAEAGIQIAEAYSRYKAANNKAKMDEIKANLQKNFSFKPWELIVAAVPTPQDKPSAPTALSR